MAIQVTDNDNEVTLAIDGRFDFSQHREFSSAYKAFEKGSKSFVVDLSRVQYMDSSAMGMLLQLREHAKKGGNESVVLSNPTPGVADILRIANFEKLFKVQ
ncbi:MAG: STAS domain-containing protein [Gammaproteobacteria bacterium SHHR-1]|uniref:STAS domain-containing protein n=1 Tax=Magnetovirga frankeli TaxID=947516 RepID=UPI001294031F|nr:STAS domain-containing protein [gamma proteobacterium SS-5]